MKPQTRSAVFFAFVLLPSLGLAQSTIQTIPGAAQSQQLGASAAWIGDIDHDGVQDYAVGSPWPEVQSTGYGILFTHNGHADVCSGASGFFLFQKDGFWTGDRYGEIVRAAGDLDGDGVGDWVVGSVDADGYQTDIMFPGTFIQGGGHVRAYSGATGAQLLQLQGGLSNTGLWVSCDRAGDVDGDGREDLITGFPYSLVVFNWQTLTYTYTPVGRAAVYSQALASELWSWTGTVAQEDVGYSVSRAGDVNGDGLADFLVLNRGGNAAFLIAGGSYATIRSHPLTSPNVNFGAFVNLVGDLDADGIADYAVGSPGDSTWAPGMGAVQVFSASTGNLITTITGQSENAKMGTLATAVGDVDLDGIVDIAVRAEKTNHSAGNVPYNAVLVLSGANGELRYRLVGSTTAKGYGASLDGGGDINNDGVPDLLLGRNDVALGAGALEVISMVPTGIGFYGSGTPGCAGPQRITADSVPKVGNAGFEIRGNNVPASTTTLVLVCDAADVAGSDSLGAGIMMHLALYQATEVLAFNGTTSGLFTSAAQAPIPNNPALAGMTYFAQEFAAWPLAQCSPSPLGLSSSAGLIITIQP
jgi:hypothetical protein